MPFRAFGDSDLEDAVLDGADLGSVSMPFRAFGDSDGEVWRLLAHLRTAFQCPFGHSGILTQLCGRGEPRSIEWVSMPFRAFGDSDQHLGLCQSRGHSEFQCPFGHSGILTQTPSSAAWPARSRFNALSGIRGF